MRHPNHHTHPPHHPPTTNPHPVHSACLQIRMVDADNGIIATGVDFITIKDVDTQMTKSRWVVAGGWQLVAGSWWLVAGSWWLAADL